MKCVISFSIGLSHIINLFDDGTWRSANVTWKTGGWHIDEDCSLITYWGDEQGVYRTEDFEKQPFITRALEDALLKDTHEDSLEHCRSATADCS